MGEMNKALQEMKNQLEELEQEKQQSQDQKNILAVQYQESKSLNSVQREEIQSLKEQIKNLNLDQSLMTTKLTEVKIENDDLNT